MRGRVNKTNADNVANASVSILFRLNESIFFQLLTNSTGHWNASTYNDSYIVWAFDPSNDSVDVGGKTNVSVP